MALMPSLCRANIRLFILLGVSLTLILFGQPGAVRVRAHSGDLLLVRSIPSINSVLSEPPQVIRLWFEDPLIAEFSRFQLRDINTRQIETPLSQINPDDPSELFIPLETELPDGLYTVTYQVISAVDGHEGVGSFAFIVGQVSDTAGHVIAYNETAPITDAGVRGLHVFALTIILGSGLYAGLKNEASRHTGQVTRIGWMLFGLAQVAMLGLQVTTLVVPDSQDFSVLLLRYLTSTRFGIIWCFTIATWLLMGLFIFTQAGVWATLGFGAVLAALTSLSSRVIPYPEMYAAVIVYWLHMVSSGLWLGGLILVTFDRLFLGSTHAEIWQKFRRFSAIALPLIALTGLYNSWLRAGTLEGLTSTAHGQALILKSLLVVGLVIACLYFARSPIRGGISQVVQIFIGLAVLIVTGVIVTLTPGREIIALRNAIPPVYEYETTIQELLTIDGLHLQLYVTPGVAGANRLDILVFESTTGTRLNDVSRLTLDLMPPEGEAYQVQAAFEGDGLYTREDVAMSAIGSWTVRMTVTRPSRQDVIAPFTVEIAAPVSTQAPVLDLTSPVAERLKIAAMTGFLLIMVGAVALSSSGIIRRPLSLYISYFFVGLSVMLLAGLFIHSLVYVVCGAALIAWMGLLVGDVRRWIRKTDNVYTMLAIASVSVGAILIISAGFIPFTVP